MSAFSRFSRTGSQISVPFDDIAAAIERTATARAFYTTLIQDDRGRELSVEAAGLVDNSRFLVLLEIHESDGQIFQRRMQIGPDVLQDVSNSDPHDTGPRWRWIAQSCPFWQTEAAERVATIRYVAQPTAVATEEDQGGPYTHYSLRCKPARNDPRPEVAGLLRHLRHHGASQLTMDVWLKPDGTLHRLRESATLARHVRGPGRPTAFTVDLWDFGTAVDLDIPAPDQIDFSLHPRSHGPTDQTG